MSRNFLFCGSADSQLKYGYAIAQAFAERGWNLFCGIDTTQKHVNERQFEELGIRCPVQLLDPFAALDSGFMDAFDAIYFQSVGSSMWSFFQAFRQRVTFRKLKTRPILLTGYVGLVIEKHLEGLLWRQGADLIAVNSERDYEIFSGYCTELGVDHRSLVRTGIPFARPQPRPQQDDGLRTILFAAQPTVPAPREQRLYILKELTDYARRNPDQQILIKQRTLPGENQFHVEKHHYQQLSEKEKDLSLPRNFQFYYGSLSDVLPHVDILITVSSTAAMEALSCEIPTLILSDFGVSEALGNHVFSGSGLVGPLNSIHRGELARPHPDWLRRNGFGDLDCIGNLVNAVEGRVSEQERLGQPCPLASMFLNQDTAPYLHRSALQRVFAPAKPAVSTPKAEPKAAKSGAKVASEAPKPDAAAKPAPKPKPGMARTAAPRRGPIGRLFRKTRKLILRPQQFFADTRI